MRGLVAWGLHSCVCFAFVAAACGSKDRQSDPTSSRVDKLSEGTLPGGTSIAVDIDTPANGAVLPSGPVTVAGTARIGGLSANTDLVYVIDVSLSTIDPVPGCGGDPNGDGRFDSVIDCEIAALQRVNHEIAASGAVSNVGIGAFGEAGNVADVSPADGVQLLTP